MNSSSKEMKRFNHLMGEINAVYHEMALKFGMSDSVMDILYTICDNDGHCMLQEICRRSGLSKQTINSAIRKLEKEGIVYLEPVGLKNKNVCLTDQGRLLAEDTAVRIIHAENDIFASWTEKDRKQYLALTKRFLEAITEKSKYINGVKR